MTCDRSVVFTGYSGFHHQYNWLTRNSWNIVESDVKHYKPPKIGQHELLIKTKTNNTGVIPCAAKGRSSPDRSMTDTPTGTPGYIHNSFHFSAVVLLVANFKAYLFSDGRHLNSFVGLSTVISVFFWYMTIGRFSLILYNIWLSCFPDVLWDRRGRMVVGFTTICAISAYHHYSCEFISRSGKVYSI